MGVLTLLRDDRVMLVGFSVATLGLIAGMRSILRQFRDASTVQAVPVKARYITQDTEDALPKATLDRLLGHYNYAIRDTAAKIVCDRAINDPATLATLLAGITRPDYDERTKNLRALAMLTDLENLHRLHTPVAYRAFVRSLEFSVGTTHYDMVENAQFDEYYLRDITEKLCLMFVSQLAAKYGADALAQAGFVDRWLARQRWGATDKERQDHFAQYMASRDNSIVDTCRRLKKSAAGRAALERAGLLRTRRPPSGPRSHERRRQQLVLEGTDFSALVAVDLAPWSVPERGEHGSRANQRRHEREHGREHESAGQALPTQGGRETGAETETENVSQIDSLDSLDSQIENQENIDWAAAPVQTRQHGQSTHEEQRIRRQHREAMVLNDGTRPLRRDDIFERESA